MMVTAFSMVTILAGLAILIFVVVGIQRMHLPLGSLFIGVTGMALGFVAQTMAAWGPQEPLPITQLEFQQARGTPVSDQQVPMLDPKAISIFAAPKQMNASGYMPGCISYGGGETVAAEIRLQDPRIVPLEHDGALNDSILCRQAAGLDP